MKVLHIDSSIMADASVSRQLSQAIVSQLSEKHAQVEVEYLDLATQPIPHLDAEILMGQNAEQSALGERIIQQYLDADVVVIGAAMYNFGITSTGLQRHGCGAGGCIAAFTTGVNDSKHCHLGVSAAVICHRPRL